MAQRHRQTAADVARIGRALRRDTIPVEKQDLESWYRDAQVLIGDLERMVGPHGGRRELVEAVEELRDRIYAYLR